MLKAKIPLMLLISIGLYIFFTRQEVGAINMCIQNAFRELRSSSAHCPLKMRSKRGTQRMTAKNNLAGVEDSRTINRKKVNFEEFLEHERGLSGE